MWLLEADEETRILILFRNQEEMMAYIAANSLHKFSIEWVHVFYPPVVDEGAEKKIYEELVPLSRSKT
jgi:hypothetical protein